VNDAPAYVRLHATGLTEVQGIYTYQYQYTKMAGIAIYTGNYKETCFMWYSGVMVVCLNTGPC